MASRPSSEGGRSGAAVPGGTTHHATGRSHGTGGWPPRAELPPGIAPVRLPVLGTTWYERGAAYWGRRAGLASVFVLAALFYAAIFWGFFRAARASGPGAFRAAVAVELVLVLSTAGYLLFHMFRRPPRPEDVALDRRRRSGPAAGAGVLARSLGPVGGIFVGAIALLTAGLLLAFLVFVLLPVWPVERTARQELAEALRARGYRLPER